MFNVVGHIFKNLNLNFSSVNYTLWLKPDELYAIGLYDEKKKINEILLIRLKKLLTHFDLNEIYDILMDLIPKAVEMELFILSDSVSMQI